MAFIVLLVLVLPLILIVVVVIRFSEQRVGEFRVKIAFLYRHPLQIHVGSLVRQETVVNDHFRLATATQPAL